MIRYTSRKFIVTMSAMILATLMAAHETFPDGLGMVLAAGIAAYNAANAYLGGKGSGPEER